VKEPLLRIVNVVALIDSPTGDHIEIKLVNFKSLRPACVIWLNMKRARGLLRALSGAIEQADQDVADYERRIRERRGDGA